MTSQHLQVNTKISLPCGMYTCDILEIQRLKPGEMDGLEKDFPKTCSVVLFQVTFLSSFPSSMNKMSTLATGGVWALDSYDMCFLKEFVKR